MMKLAVSFVFAALVACASAQTTLTGQYTCDTSGDYQLCQDQWGSGWSFVASLQLSAYDTVRSQRCRLSELHTHQHQRRQHYLVYHLYLGRQRERRQVL